MTMNQVRFLLGTPMIDDPFAKSLGLRLLPEDRSQRCRAEALGIGLFRRRESQRNSPGSGIGARPLVGYPIPPSCARLTPVAAAPLGDRARAVGKSRRGRHPALRDLAQLVPPNSDRQLVESLTQETRCQPRRESLPRPLRLAAPRASSATASPATQRPLSTEFCHHRLPVDRVSTLGE